ncbi:MAG: NADPH-dependent glutamate synthase [Candidatus Omnitrophica bacterium]|nr:NADPH-dependent glutamate synthase [Candidatus Omnitrophota bacterium]
MKKIPIKVKEIPVEERVGSFKEVVLGYSEAEALLEAERCLQCKNPLCISGCPVGIDIKKFIYQISKKDYQGAYYTIREKNNFPSICGRVCPAEYQCRKACVLTKKGLPFASPEAINIHFLERFAGDWGMENLNSKFKIQNSKFADVKVAVVGSGPAGLCCAGELARVGVKVTIYESLHKPGGVLRYGIPTFRLPQEILDREINYLKELGVEIITNTLIGKTKTIEEIFKEGYKAIFLGLGAGIPSLLNIKGENLGNIYSANEFLTRVNLLFAYKFPDYHTPINVGKKIVVIGGGNTAMDAARVALRLQVINKLDPDVTLLYRRTEKEMPARRLEITHAQEEGVKFRFLVQPKEFVSDVCGFVKGIICLECKLGEADSSGRPRSLPIPGSDFFIEADSVIIAIGLRANQLLTRVTPQIKTDKYGNIIVEPQTMETSLPAVFAGGDIVGGEGTIIEAMGMAKRAARSLLKKLKLARRKN